MKRVGGLWMLGAGLMMGGHGIQAGNPMEEWTWASPYPQGQALNSVAFGDGRFVAVGEGGVVISSTNGFDWRLLRSGTTENLNGVAESEGRFVAVGAYGSLLTWTDDADIGSATSGLVEGLNAVGSRTGGADGYKWLVVGGGGVALRSANGLVWERYALATSNHLYAVTTGSTVWTVVGAAGTVRITDGSTVASRDSPTDGDLLAVASGEGRSVAAGDLGDYFGPNGLVWNAILSSTNRFLSCETTAFEGVWGSEKELWFPSQTFTVQGLASGAGRFVAVGYCGGTLYQDYPGVILASTNGVDWVELPDATSQMVLTGVAHGNGVFVAVGACGSILVSRDGTEWSAPAGLRRTDLLAAASGEGRILAVGAVANTPYTQFGDVAGLVSADGEKWERVGGGFPEMRSLVWDGGRFVGLSLEGRDVLESVDGRTWATNHIGDVALTALTRGDGLWVAVGGGGAIWISMDARTWVDRSVQSTNRYSRFNAIHHDGARFIAAGNEVARSVDGVNWSLATNVPLSEIVSMASGRGVICATTSAGILRSADGSEWSLSYAGPVGGWTWFVCGIAQGNGLFVTVVAGSVVYSYDGDAWRTVPAPRSSLFTWGDGKRAPTAFYDRGRFYVLASFGSVLRSGDMRVPIAEGSLVQEHEEVRFEFRASAGMPYRVQATSDLVAWEDVVFGVGSGPVGSYAEPAASREGGRFFRVVSP